MERDERQVGRLDLRRARRAIDGDDELDDALWPDDDSIARAKAKLPEAQAAVKSWLQTQQLRPEIIDDAPQKKRSPAAHEPPRLPKSINSDADEFTSAVLGILHCRLKGSIGLVPHNLTKNFKAALVKNSKSKKIDWTNYKFTLTRLHAHYRRKLNYGRVINSSSPSSDTIAALLAERICKIIESFF